MLYTLYWGLAKFRFGASLQTPDCLSKLSRLMVQEQTGDPVFIASACMPDPHAADRILPFYYNSWWSPFDPSKNWDGREETIVKIYRLQAHSMPPPLVPPIVSTNLSDLATGELVECVRSLQSSRVMLDLDSTETLKQMTQTMMLIARLKALHTQVKAEEQAQVTALASSKVSEATGLTVEAAAELLRKARVAPIT